MKFPDLFDFEDIDPDVVAAEEMPLTARLIEKLFDDLPDELEIVEEEEAKWKE